MKKLSLYIFLVLMWCNIGFAAPIAYGKWEPAKYYLECPVENIEEDGLKKRLKYIGIGENDFFIDYETRAAKQWFVNSLLIDRDFSSEGELESEPFENNKYYITLVEKDYQLSAFDRFNKKLFSLSCKTITKKELKKIRTPK